MRGRKTGVFIFLLLISGRLGSLFCETFDTELHLEIANLKQASAPRVVGSNILLSYSAPPISQSIALALEHEDYRTLHRYQKNKHGIFVLALPLPEGKQKIRYRLVVDGLWTTDPNTKKEEDSRRFPVSYFIPPDSTGAPESGVEFLADGRTRFTYRGASGSKVSLLGDFNRWDPFLTPMPESPIYPGVYSVALKLPDEARFYQYALNGKRITDPANPRFARNGWDETISIIK